MPEAIKARPGLTAILVVALGFLVLFVTGGARFAIGLTLKPMAEELTWGRSAIGGAVALFLVVSATCMFVAGRLADRFSLHLVLSLGLVMGAAGAAAMGWISEPWHVLLVYGVIFAIGNGLASLAPVGVMVNRLFPNRAGLANAVAISGTGVGQLVMIAGFAAALLHIGWRSMFVWLGIVHIVLLPVILTVLRSRASVSPAAAFRTETPLSQALRHRHFWLLAGLYAICGFQDFFVATHVVAFALDANVDTLLAGNLLALMGICGVAGVLLAGFWSDRHSPWWPTLTCFVVRIVLFTLVLNAQNTTAIAVFALLFGVTFWMTAPLAVVFVREAFGNANVGSLSGLIVMIHHMAGGLGALSGALFFDGEGHYDTVFRIMLILTVVATIGMAMLPRWRGG